MKLSDQKKQKICEQIINYLFSVNPKPVFTSQIANEVARDEEFVKKLLLELKTKNLIVEINKNPEGKQYAKRRRWLLNHHVYSTYKKLNSF